MDGRPAWIKKYQGDDIFGNAILIVDEATNLITIIVIVITDSKALFQAVKDPTDSLWKQRFNARKVSTLFKLNKINIVRDSNEDIKR